MTLSKKVLARLLIVSLAVNLFLIAFGVTRLIRMAERRPPPHAAFRLGRVLGKGASPEVRRVMREHMEGARPHRRALREARGEVRDALEAEPFDPQRLESALADLRERSQNVQKAMHEGLSAVAKDLDPQQRRRLANENLGRHHRKPGRDTP